MKERKYLLKLFNIFVKHIGDDPEREGLQDSLRRVGESYAEILDGYTKDPAKIVKTCESDYKGLLLFSC